MTSLGRPEQVGLAGRLLQACYGISCARASAGGPRSSNREEMPLRDKTVLITGSTDGVGRKVAIELGKLGAKVLVHGRDTTRAREVVAEIARGGGVAEFYAADLASLTDVRALAAVVAQDHDKL